MTPSSTLARSLPLAALFVLACGGLEPDTEPATHDDFRAIQRQETRIESALGEARDLGRACEARCHAAAVVCEAARAICRIADDTADLDVRARCRHAEDACREAPHSAEQSADHATEPCGCARALSSRRAAPTAS